MNSDTSPTRQQVIGAHFRRKRTEQGFTQVTLSNATGIDQRTVSDLERGNWITLNLDHLEAICHATDTPPSAYLGTLDERFHDNRPRRLAQVAS